MSPKPVSAARPLVAGEVVRGGPAVPGPHRYEVAVPAGHYLRVVARQLGLDVALRLVPPGGPPAAEVDSPWGSVGDEAAHAVAEAGGRYVVEVEYWVDDGAAPDASYELRVADLRPATAEDRLRTDAESALAVAEGVRRTQSSGLIEAYAAAVELAERLGDDRLLAYGLYRLAYAEADEGRTAAAEPHYRRSLELAVGRGDLDLEALVRNGLGALERRLGRFEQALGHQRRALALFRRAGGDDLIAETLAGIGSTLDLLGRQHEAQQAFEESLALWRPLGDPPNSALTRLRFGEMLLSLGKLDEAADQFTVAARVAEGAGDGLSASAVRGLGVVRSRRRDAAGAISHFERALAAARGAGHHALLAVTLGDVATARLQLGETGAARRALGEALSIARRLGHRSLEAALLHKLAQCHHAAGEHGESARLHAEAAEAFARNGDPVALAGARFGLARAHRLAGDPRAGLAALDEALAAAEAVRRAVGGQDLQAAYLGSKRHYRELHVDLWMELHAREPDGGHDLAALLADDRGRARSLVALLEEAAGGAAAAPAELLAEREALGRRLAQLRLVAERLGAEAGSEEEALAEVRRRQRQLLLQLDRLHGELRRGGSHQAARHEAARHEETRHEETLPRPLAAESLDGLLDEDTLLLVYSLGEERSFLWALWRGGRRSVVLPPRREIELLATRVAARFSSGRASDREAAERAAGELSRHLLGPIASDLPRHRRLAIVADGGLHFVPFAALPDPAAPGEPLVASHEVAMLPSLTVLDRLRRRSQAPRSWRGVAAVMADPVFDAADPRVGGGGAAGAGRYPRLRGTREEAEALLRLLPPGAKVFRGFDFAADRAAILSGALSGYRIVHLATHGVLDRRTPALSGLVFSLVDEAGRPRDGHLQLHEVYGLELDAEVIVLSACQSGIGQDMEGEGLIGLTRGFLDAGAPRLVVSLWQVGDRGSAELVERFYRSWLFDGEAPAAALAAAQRSMWSDAEWSDPYHWAGFQLVGDWSAAAPPPERPAAPPPKGPDEPIEKPSSGVPNEPKPDDPLPGPREGGKKPPPK